jgi:hypothetical protein
MSNRRKLRVTNPSRITEKPGGRYEAPYRIRPHRRLAGGWADSGTTITIDRGAAAAFSARCATSERNRCSND